MFATTDLPTLSRFYPKDFFHFLANNVFLKMAIFKLFFFEGEKGEKGWQSRF